MSRQVLLVALLDPFYVLEAPRLRKPASVEHQHDHSPSGDAPDAADSEREGDQLAI